MGVNFSVCMVFGKTNHCAPPLPKKFPVIKNILCFLQSISDIEVLPPGVSNVDDYDCSDPQQCSENVRSIYVYLRHLERAQPIKEDFLMVKSLVLV